ncbi:MAG TPA: trigger factor [Candidatus Saccharimonadales bacterium]|nr:trigger factor [Candidatus Saccharimonadales bacterium]
MKSTIKNLSDTKVELTIVLDAEELAIAAQVATTKLARDVKVQGFRKGKAPAAVAAKNIDPEKLQEQILDNAVSKAVSEAFLESKLQALDRPAVEIKKYVPGEMLEFTAETEILPVIKLGDYKKLKPMLEKVTVDESEVAETLGRIRESLAERKEVKRAAKIGDETVIDFVGKKDGVAFPGGTGNDYNLKLGLNQFIPGFEDGIVGHNAGETFDLKLKFPDDYQSAELKGKNVTFTTILKTVREVVLPEIDDQLAAKAGPFKTITELKTDIKRELTAQKQREAGERLKDDLVKQLVAVSKVPVPEILVVDQSKSIERDFVNNLMYQGLSIDQYLENKGFESKEKWLETEVKDVATKRVQAGLVLAELSKVEKIEASTTELDTHVEMYKKQYANNAEALKQFEQPEVRRDIASRLLTEKTVDRLVELNTKK